MTLSARPGVLVGPIGRVATAILDVAVGVVAPLALMLVEALAVQFLGLIPLDTWVDNALVGLSCLLWLAALLALARRGRTPASLVMRRCWVDGTGQSVSWGPLGGVAFWLAALPALFTLITFGENLLIVGQANAWNLLPPFANIPAGGEAAGILIVAIALPPYLRFRRQAAYVRP